MEDPYAVLSWSFFLLFCFLFFLLLETFLFFLTKLWYSNIQCCCREQCRQAQRFLLLITPCSLILGFAGALGLISFLQEKYKQLLLH